MVISNIYMNITKFEGATDVTLVKVKHKKYYIIKCKVGARRARGEDNSARGAPGRRSSGGAHRVKERERPTPPGAGGGAWPGLAYSALEQRVGEIGGVRQGCWRRAGATPRHQPARYGGCYSH